MTLSLVCPQNLWCSACWKQVGGCSHSPGEVIEQGCGCLQGSLRALSVHSLWVQELEGEEISLLGAMGTALPLSCSVQILLTLGTRVP